MATINNNFLPSINIERDAAKELFYLTTPNTQSTYTAILKNTAEGRNAFTLIGSYGTGKSAFLLAFERQLKREKRHFTPEFAQADYHIINLTGENTSLIQFFLDAFPGKHKTAAGCFKAYLQAQAKQGITTVLCIDECGKYLEYAAQNPQNATAELYLLQQIAELANDTTLNFLFIITLHQNVEGYFADTMRSEQEWQKVKGRFIELPFNEPVEQLLLLAAQYLTEVNTENTTLPDSLPQVFEAVETARIFRLRNHFQLQLAEQLYPLDLVAANVITQALNEYGQRDRSLFAFLIGDDERGLRNYNTDENPYYNVACVYDYLEYNLYSKLHSKQNPHYTQWSALRRTVQRVELEEDNTLRNAALKIVKTVGLLDIFTNAASINDAFLHTYATHCLSVLQVEKVLDYLVRIKCLKYKNFKNSYNLSEGTDIDLQVELAKATAFTQPITSVATKLQQYFTFPYFPAKQVHYVKGMPRFFEFKISDTVEHAVPTAQIDGVATLVFAEQKQGKKQTGTATDEALLTGFYNDVESIRTLLFDIERINEVRKKVSAEGDRVALAEIDELRAYHTDALNSFILKSIYSDTNEISWYFGEEEKKITSWRQFNETLTDICEKVYADTPTFQNELINRHKFGGQIATAKKKLFRLLTTQYTTEHLGFSKDEFPPEKTIYLSLLKQTGIHAQNENGGYTLQAPTETSFRKLWDASEAFLNSTIGTRKSLTDLEQILSKKPFKLKQGFIDFWLPIFVFIRRDDIALFQDDIFIHTINADVLDLIAKSTAEFEIRKYDIQGVKLDLFQKYRTLVQRTSEVKATSETFIETIKPFLRFYREIPEYSKKTKHLSPQAIAVRTAIATAKEPETVFFNAFPAALNYDITTLNNSEDALETYITDLQDAIRELRTAYEELINRLELFLQKEIGAEGLPFVAYREMLQKRYTNLQTHLLLPQQRVLHNRINSQLDDRRAYIASLAQCLLNRNLEAAQDTDERIFYTRLSAALRELDNLTQLTTDEINTEKEQVFKIEITTFGTPMSSDILRINTEDDKNAQKTLDKMKKLLGDDKKQNAALLFKLLQATLSEKQ